MTGLHIALGFKSAASVEEPEVIYLGNDLAACRKAIDGAVKDKEFGRILRGLNFAHTLTKVGLQQAELVKVDCSPEARAKHLATLATDAKEIAANAADEAARKKAAGDKIMADIRAVHEANKANTEAQAPADEPKSKKGKGQKIKGSSPDNI